MSVRTNAASAAGPRPQPAAPRPQDLPTKAELARLRVEYAKDERLAYLGHLEVLGTLERSIRRAGLPFSLGNGFARRMRVQFSQALPVGASSACEYFDLRLTERVDPGEALELLRAATPGGLAPLRAAYVPGRLPALEAWLDRSWWEVEARGVPWGADELARALAAVAERGELTWLRGDKPKTVDVASTLVAFEAADAGGGVLLALQTALTGGNALRPQVLVDEALSGAGLARYDSLRVRRVRQAHEEDGRLVEPLSPCGETGAPSLS